MDSVAHDQIAAARSFLFVPGSHPDRFTKAAASLADAVILDLEDAVPLQEKDDARQAAAGWVADHDSLVRVNAAGTAQHDDDVRALAGRPGLMAVVVPKAECSEDLEHTADATGAPVIALVESAAGLLRAQDIARSPAVARLALGNLDYATDLGLFRLAADEPELVVPRSFLALASAAASLPGPVDGVHPAVDDEEGLDRVCARARDLGMAAKFCIHPRQVTTVARLFAPAADAVAWARDVLAAADAQQGGVGQHAGEMVDRPQYERARAILARVQREG